MTLFNCFTVMFFFSKAKFCEDLDYFLPVSTDIYKSTFKIPTELLCKKNRSIDSDFVHITE